MITGAVNACWLIMITHTVNACWLIMITDARPDLPQRHR
jgi:hypothetical protein